MLQCWSAQKSYLPDVIVRTEGCWMHTDDGRKIFDLRSAHECINLGFNHPRVLDAMQKQMNSLIYITDDFASEPTALLAKKLSDITPGEGNKKVWFGQSGAGAVEAALKVARFYKYNQLLEKGREAFQGSNQYPYPYKIISRYRSWHGAGGSAMSASGDPRRWFGEPVSMPGVVFAPDAYPYRSPFGEDPDGHRAADYLEYIIEMEGGSGFVAAVIVEPVVGSNGIIPAPKAYMKRVREICDKHGLLLIVDETMTGLGRTGKMLAIEHYDVVPDILVMGKALGVYCPLSACIVSAEVASTFDDYIFGHGQSFSGHALACRAALESLKVIEEEGILENTVKLGEYLHQELKKLGDKHPSVGEVRGLGLMWTLELVKDRESKKPIRSTGEKYDDNPVKELADFLYNEKDIYLPSDKFGVWIMPPLIVTADEIDMIVSALDKALEITDDYYTGNNS